MGLNQLRPKTIVSYMNLGHEIFLLFYDFLMFFNM